jgi:exosortase
VTSLLSPIKTKQVATSLSAMAWPKAAAIAGLLLGLYHSVLAEMAVDWWTEPAWSQGLLIPPLAGYIAWLRRQETLKIAAQEDLRGLWLTGAACLLFLLGNLGAEFFLSRISFVILLVALVWTFWGVGRLQTLAFPFLLLVTMVPLPTIVYNALTAPLQMFATSSASAIAQALGVTVFQDGNIINLAHVSLGVEEACSGLNSLSALAVAAILLAYLICVRLRTRVLLILLSIPLAIGINVLRVAGTALIADYREEFAMGFYHLFSGWLVFVMGFGLLYGAALALHRFAD